MNQIKMIFGRLLILSLFTHTAKAQQSVELATFNEVMKIMSQHYYDSNFGGLDWGKISNNTREEIKKTDSSKERYKLISKQIKMLKHSHLEFHPPFLRENKSKVQIPGGSPKQRDFNMEFVDGKWRTTHVKNDSPAWKAGLRPGHIVVKLNDWRAQDTFSGKSTMDYYRMKMTLNRYPKKNIQLTVHSKDGEEKTPSWKLSPYKGRVSRMGNLSERIEVEKKILPGNIGYISFNIYLVPPVMRVIQAIKEFRDKGCPGIIIDVRNNPGGIATLSSAIAKEFCSKKYNLGTQKGRENVLTFPVFPQPKPYTGKVVILQNRYSASTSEVMAAGIQTNKSATVIGETSAGMALPSVILNLDDGSVLQYPVADFKTVDGKTIEGIGVIPDIKATHSAESLNAGKDIFIETALKHLNKKEESP